MDADLLDMSKQERRKLRRQGGDTARQQRRRRGKGLHKGERRA